MSCGIYKIENKVNGKVYIGSSANLSRRLYEHRRLLRNGVHRNAHLQSAWIQYGEESFDLRVIELTAVDALFYERKWIAAFRSAERDFGYNIAVDTQANQLGLKRSPQTCALIGASKIGNKNRLGKSLPQEVREQIAKKLRGRRASQATKDKLSAMRKGVPKSSDWVEKIQASRAATLARRKSQTED